MNAVHFFALARAYKTHPGCSESELPWLVTAVLSALNRKEGVGVMKEDAERLMDLCRSLNIDADWRAKVLSAGRKYGRVMEELAREPGAGHEAMRLSKMADEAFADFRRLVDQRS